jgi:hypothetical protein
MMFASVSVLPMVNVRFLIKMGMKKHAIIIVIAMF